MAEISLSGPAGEPIAVITPVDKNGTEQTNLQWEIRKSEDGYYYYPKDRKEDVSAKKLSSETLQEFFGDIENER